MGVFIVVFTSLNAQPGSQMLNKHWKMEREGENYSGDRTRRAVRVWAQG